MGSVWKARHASLGTPAAIKFIEAEYANSQEARNRFDREAKAAATIQSKHAIQIYDHGVTEDGKPYIVMELLTGEPLDKRIERLGTLTLQDTARILLQVSRGLARAHERGIVHRDLKPDNIFVVRNTDDDEEVAKVLDFGIAKIQSSTTNPGLSSSTKTGAVLGTPFYMSPEQARGLRNVDHRTDVWSLGVIAFKCVTGRLPFDGESVGDLLVKICTSPVPLPSQVAPHLPQAFDTWFLRALERDPERRFPDVNELAASLTLAAGLPARGTPAPHSNGDPTSATVSASGSGAASALRGGSGHPRPGSVPPVGRYLDARVATASPPAPAAGMTAAPFTSSQPAPRLGSSTWKWLVGIGAAALVLGAVGTGIVTTLNRRGPGDAARLGVGVTQAPASAAVAPPLPSGSPAPEATGLAAADLDAAPAPAAGVGAKPTGRPSTATPKAGPRAAVGPPGLLPLPPAGGVALPPPATTAHAAPPVTAPAVPAVPPKKPISNDPGY
jgi:serine/threonine-protein kinase